MSRGDRGPKNADVEELSRNWGVHIDGELLVLALTHRSFANEMGGLPHNERLEFLGDSVLSIVVTDFLFHRFPDSPESELAKMRSATVSQTPLAEMARRIGLGDFILLGVGENKMGGRDKDSILSDTLEALIGATYLSEGMETTRAVVLELLGPLLDDVENRGKTMDWKTPLMEYAQSKNVDVVYQVQGSGPDHARMYDAEVLVNGQVLGSAQSSSKRHAENLAAKEALDSLGYA
ncbi:ribonuclease III [Actinomycetaceae bacterium WB03_NA08]|uniref:Ribonuclease 3 n=1 Tax=Scrofimicrobium canadense TaxID=2652290 RepID=A0A6N7VPK0_9ACTO|nr:ribonuclease III [Scrofimicrobium canadense]MSS83664.1 ribonuclease III [Scrofimicrobium canadense]